LVCHSQFSDQPEVIVLDRVRGCIAIAVSNNAKDDADIRTSLNLRILEVTKRISEFERLPFRRAIVYQGNAESVGRVGKETVVLSRSEYLSGAWFRQLPSIDVDVSAIETIAARLHSSLVFPSRARKGASDAGKKDRAAERVVLDRLQASAAQVEVPDVLLITGPPGSGKTLALAARARWYSHLHPEWKIQIVCYNRSLQSFLHSLVRRSANVEVATFTSFSRSRAQVFSNLSNEAALRDLAKARKQGIMRDIDLLLVDEWQDFAAPWIEYCLDTVVKGRGGACFAGDEKQALYQESPPVSALQHRDVVQVVLDRPYRSTKQILQFTALLDELFQTDGIDLSLEGEPIDVIHAGSWDEQAEAAVWEARKLIESGERNPDQIGIICSRKSIVSRVTGLLEEAEIEYELLGSSSNSKYEGSLERVTVSTVHSAKGLEFDVVILLGLDAIKPVADADLPQKSRVAYVGPTRARDQLIITFTKPTTMIRRLRNAPQALIRHWEFPDDFQIGG